MKQKPSLSFFNVLALKHDITTDKAQVLRVKKNNARVFFNEANEINFKIKLKK